MFGLKFVNDLGVLSGVKYKTISICDNKEKTLVLVEKANSTDVSPVRLEIREITCTT